MTYEVEMKFPLAPGQELEPLLAELGAKPGAPIEQADRYFQHPSRDFGTSDEALRLRSVGDHNVITYKGPKLDPVAKTRKEIEIPYATGVEAQGQFAELLTRLGFQESLTVRKTRRPFHLTWEERDVEVVIDDVAGLGRFAEIETIADESGRDAAKACVLSLAAKLGLESPERRSYLRMLLELGPA